MQQSEQSKLTAEDRAELERNIKELELEILTLSRDRAKTHDISIATADIIMNKNKELRRLRRLRGRNHDQTLYLSGNIRTKPAYGQ